ncbi:UNVERIFIED_CONTAM: hypothetical protein GTU68_055344 [Idotea baltica]|nr:hypothetical protein [Idotea baltica]
MSSFSGKIKEFPQISVDRFDGRNLASTAYFLSHAHSDHMIGLSSPQFLDHLESNSGLYLYCSQITARFLQASIRHRPLSPYVVPLPHEEPVKITVPNVAEEATHQLWVTLIPAAHCPGSIMFLFEGRGGTVLYTGDFRISAGEVARLRPLHNPDGTVKTIDSLHIDTTFCHRDIIHFPSREESSQAVGEAVEEWLARGNNFLIHLVCPAKYGYEYIYRSLHDRFGMKIHVSRWKYRMYDTVPEIQDVLTLDATMTWIHACEYRVSILKNRTNGIHCRTVSNDGSFCRVLLSMHASCSEVLDMVSYLRPRKVFPNVIPSNSTKEEVLKLLHEALNRSGDHYSIEYGGSQRTGLGSFKRQLHTSESSCNGGNSSSSSILEAGLLDVYLASPNKRRRHSDSNMTLVLPTPRGNMKGSLSLEGETRHEPKGEEPSQPSTSSLASKHSQSESVEDELEWRDPYSPSPLKTPNFFQSSTETCITECSGAKRNLSTDLSVASDADGGRRNSLNGKRGRMEKSASDVEEEEAAAKGFLKMDGSQDSIELNSVFSDEGDRDSIFDPVDMNRPCSSTGIPEESPIKRSRKMWYKHKYFSTPVHDEVEKGHKLESKPCIGPRSSSLPLPESYRDALMSPDFFLSTDGERNLPLITVSSPSDPASESQVSDETNVTVVLSSGEPSDSDVLLLDELPPDNTSLDNSAVSASVRPSVICSPPKPDAFLPVELVELENNKFEMEKWRLNSLNKLENSGSPLAKDRLARTRVQPSDTGWIDCNKIKTNKNKVLLVKEDPRTVLELDNVHKKYKVSISESNSFVSPDLVNLVSDGECSPEFDAILLPQSQKDIPDSLPCSTRSSCLKTVRRKHDHVEVVSLDHQPL